MNLLVIQCLIGVQFTGTGSLLIRNRSAVQHNHFIITCLFLIQGYSWRQRFWRGTCTHSWDEWRSTPRPSPPIHPRPSSVISCDSELSPLQAGWLIDQFNQIYMWKLCKTFALSMPVRQLSWQEKSFFSCIIHLYLLFLALMYLWSAFLPPFLHKSLEGFCIDTKGKKSLCCSLKNTNARNARCTEHVLSFMKDINIFFWQWTLTPKDAQQGPRSDSAPGYCTPTWAEALPIKDINMH